MRTGLTIDKITFTKVIDLGHSIIRMRNDGIVQVNFGDDTDLDVKESTEVVDAIGILTEGKKALILNIAGKHTTASSGARDHSASQEGLKYTIADAFVTKSLAQKILGNFYMNFHKPAAPTKMFDSETKAVEWLRSYL